MSGRPGRPDAERRGARLLVVGAMLGMALTAWGLVGSSAPPPSLAGAVAVVNGQRLPRETFDRLVAAVRDERRTAVLSLEDRQRILDRLVDEELLLQYGLGLGLARHEPTARRVILQAVIASVTGAAEAVDPSEADLREYYARNPDRFVRSGRLVLEVAAVSLADRSEPEARSLAGRVAAAWAAGTPLARLQTDLPGVTTPRLPGGPLPAETIRRYLGPTAALRAQALAAGEVSPPFRASARYLVLRLVERKREHVPAFEEVADQVRAEWTRSRGEAALARFVDDLRAAADLEMVDLAAEPAARATAGSKAEAR